jgi:hypothetical protein
MPHQDSACDVAAAMGVSIRGIGMRRRKRFVFPHVFGANATASIGDWNGLVRRACLVLFVSIAFAGCGSDQSSVSGKLTLDGKPLARSENVQVTIMFFPESGSGAPAAAMADESGRYELATGGRSGLAPGNYVVTLIATEVTPAANGGAPIKRVATPLRYANQKQSGLRAEVQLGRNTFDFDLTSQGNS